MTHEVRSCKHCGSENIHKIPSDYSTTVRQKTFKSPAGTLVKKYIEDTKKDIKRQKKELKTEMH